jgi:hypothetical protein
MARPGVPSTDEKALAVAVELLRHQVYDNTLALVSNSQRISALTTWLTHGGAGGSDGGSPTADRVEGVPVPGFEVREPKRAAERTPAGDDAAGSSKGLLLADILTRIGEQIRRDPSGGAGAAGGKFPGAGAGPVGAILGGSPGKEFATMLPIVVSEIRTLAEAFRDVSAFLGTWAATSMDTRDTSSVDRVDRGAMAALRMSIGPGAQMGSLSEVGKAGSVAALQQDQPEARLMREMIKILEKIERAVAGSRDARAQGVHDPERVREFDRGREMLLQLLRAI